MFLITHHFDSKFTSLRFSASFQRENPIPITQRKFKTINKSMMKKHRHKKSFSCFRVSHWKIRVYVESVILCSKREFRRNFDTHDFKVLRLFSLAERNVISLLLSYFGGALMIPFDCQRAANSAIWVVISVVIYNLLIHLLLIISQVDGVLVGNLLEQTWFF